MSAIHIRGINGGENKFSLMRRFFQTGWRINVKLFCETVGWIIFSYIIIFRQHVMLIQIQIYAGSISKVLQGILNPFYCTSIQCILYMVIRYKGHNTGRSLRKWTKARKLNPKSPKHLTASSLSRRPPFKITDDQIVCKCEVMMNPNRSTFGFSSSIWSLAFVLYGKLYVSL